MTYSYTEKKRIRKSFAKRASVLDVPVLLATELEACVALLQRGKVGPILGAAAWGNLSA